MKKEAKGLEIFPRMVYNKLGVITRLDTHISIGGDVLERIHDPVLHQAGAGE
jgi:hypothetical protein